MKILATLTLLLLFSAGIAAQGPQPGSMNAKRIYSGTAVPTMGCSPGPTYRDIYIRTTDNSEYQCTAAPSTWTKVTSGTPATTGIGGSTGATDNAILRADGTGGATLQNSLPTITDTGAFVFVPSVWNTSSDAKNRLFFLSNGPTYFGTGDAGGYIWQDTSAQSVASLSNLPTPTFSLQSDGLVGFSSSAIDTGPIDTTISRNAAGIVQVGTTTANASGSLLATGVSATGSLTIGSGTAILKHLSATATLNFASQVGVGCENLTITVTGAAVGDTVAIGIPNASIVTNGVFYGWVSATDTVSVKFCAVVSGDPASGAFRADVWQH